MAILELADPTVHDVALVTGAGGGVGILLVQAIARKRGTVVGLARGAEKLAVVDGCGALVVADHSRPGWREAVREGLGGRQVTLALDAVGGELGRAVLELVGVGGRVVMFGTASSRPTELSSTDLYGFGISVSAAVGARLLGRPGGLRPLEESELRDARDGRWTPVIGQRFRLADAVAAHEAIEARATIRKTVLHP